MITSCRMSDVAAEAGVSVATVSNVLNRPQKVKTETRARIRAAIDRLGYVRNEQAYELRLRARTRTNKRRASGEPWTTEDGVRDESLGPIPQRIQIPGTSGPLQLLEGSHVGLISRDRVIAKGWMETVTADESTAWIWLDAGGGRRMIHAGDGIDLLILEEVPDAAHTTEAKNTKPKRGVTTEGN
ncbi:hypothetical protein ASG92_22490 [Arthrobacter sp. Soil736]|uniref:LacI family DNA-binding transcriptional regulator n=1 Tax=Arthrobacter sp. Soil736 TaxID=1736395 RepID=UPI0007003FE7|nr:LacI family DNA-binding transcriptional regulator [Arthrobacter sp. Soil736]KRE59402.1 hypothetical protein ASG92_22490 [Arthrobacter sp. Soil736]